MISALKAKAKMVYQVLSRKDIRLWQKIDLLMSRKTQGDLQTGLMIAAPLLWFIVGPYGALVPILLLISYNLYYGLCVGGCELALQEVFIYAFLAGFIFSLKLGIIALIATAIAWAALVYWDLRP